LTCPACALPALPGRRFCTACGAVLGPACTGCSLPLAPGDRFCGGCGRATDAADASAVPIPVPAAPAPGAGSARAKPVAERRVVTVLFADLVGFTTFSEGRDAEDVRETLSRYFEIGREIIGRHGGTVEKFIGDAVMAVWGAPIAHEDDPERAIRAALELIAAIPSLGPGISARAGVHTGEAAVTIGAVGEGMVAGDLVNTAARIQAAAEPGSVFAGEATVRGAEGAFSFVSVGDRQMKGKAAPVPVWRAEKPAGGSMGHGGLATPFVGRSDELESLRDAFRSVRARGTLRHVSLIGPGGIGKSRLAWELLRIVDSQDELVWWHDGRCPAYGEGVSFWALAEMVRQRCFLLEDDDEETVRERIATKAADLVEDPAERRRLERGLLALLGLEGGLPADQLFAAWRTFFERHAAVAPVVLLFEDLHFADPGLLDFIESLVERSADHAILVITLARPELTVARPRWASAHEHEQALLLAPLDAPRIRELLSGLVPGIPGEALDLVVQRADGMPLYAVETIRKLVADGRIEERDGVYAPVGDLSTVSVPESLAALIASRLDALDPADRSLVSDASVLGQSFGLPALAAVSGIPLPVLGARVDALVRREILAREEDPRSAAAGQIAFVQALIREVAYNTLAKRDRLSRHLAYAEHLEALGGAGESAGLLAAQYTAAVTLTNDEAQREKLSARLREVLEGAAERAAALGSTERASALLDRALQTGASGEDEARLLEEAGVIAARAGRSEEAERHLRAAIAAHEAAGEMEGILRATASLAGALLAAGRARDAEDRIERALAEHGPGADPGALAELVRRQVAVLLVLRPEHAPAACDRAIALADRAGRETVVADLLVTKARLAGAAGRRLEGIAIATGAVRLAEAADRAEIAVAAEVVAAELHGTDEPLVALEAARRARAVAGRLEGGPEVQLAVVELARLLVATGAWAEAATEIGSAADRRGPAEADPLLAVAAARLALARGGDPLLPLPTADAGSPAELTAALRAHAAELALLEGRAEDAWTIAWDGPAVRVGGLPLSRLAARAALLAGDPARLRRAADRFLDEAAAGAGGRIVDTERRFHAAGLAALDGRPDEALFAFTGADAAYEILGLVPERGSGALILLALLGARDPEAIGLAVAIRESLAELGADGLVARLDTAIAAAARPRGG